MREHNTMKKALPVLLFLLVFAISSTVLPALAQDETAFDPVDTTEIVPQLETPAPVASVSAEDTPDDAGKSITISWEPSPDDAGGRKNVAKYIVMRATSPGGPFDTVGSATAGMTMVSDGQVENGIDYYYQVIALASELLPSGDEIYAGAAPKLSSAVQASGRRWHGFI